MSEYSNRYTQNPVIQRLRRYFWIFVIVLPLVVMMIPSVIVNYFSSKSTMENFSSIPTHQHNLNQKSVPKPLITLGWLSGTASSIEQLNDYENLDVVSPDFAVIDSNGHLKLDPQQNFSTMIETQGKKNWPRITMELDTKAANHVFLSNPAQQQQVIQSLYQAAIQQQWEGVNIDMENVDVRDRDLFSQFIENLSAVLHKSHLILSVDIPPDQKEGENQLSPFDHADLAKTCDYLVFMGYDEHWSTDPIAGPVTSLNWLDENIKELIQTGIPSDKIILGLPSYTRLWESNAKGYIVNNPAFAVGYVEKLMNENHHSLNWDSTLGEYYTSYDVNNIHYQVWLPSQKSYDLYLKLCSTYHLAGAAVWNLDFMTSAYWNSIDQFKSITMSPKQKTVSSS
ncbi:glycosyl hydrolase family 18 protein [Heyndrickxia acidicola]|uniref:Glycosyl hydrolase family 18 protein n=1 Tax=Heyndrickxia acidicola TaxID=209389 RepID=A0ABU6MIX6_9BACI|nr:glycosyl hydrolase family 18 protein [Heyndrickxia acidicola]MED1203608.1 glycosyl hydrolase family 18 protein [Heyndrickxia acidicola]